MIRMYSKKYFCRRCKDEEGKMKRLYGEKNDKGERVLLCEKHGYQQHCNCSPSDFEVVII